WAATCVLGRGAGWVAARAGPAIGAIVATLPVAAGPAYVFVALDHDSGFIAASAIGSITAHAATAVFSLVFIVLAQRNNMVVSVGGAVAVWFIVAFLLRQITWSFVGAVAVNLALFGACIAVTDRYRHVRMPAIVRKWYDIPVRALMVACPVAAVVCVRGHVGPTVTGLLAVYPSVMSSLMLIFQPRVGGPATAALIANTMWGLVGFSAGLFTVQLAVLPFRTWVGFTLSLTVSVVWNIVLYGWRRRAIRRRI